MDYIQDSTGHYYEKSDLFSLSQDKLDLVKKTNINDAELIKRILDWKTWYTPMNYDDMIKYHVISSWRSDEDECPFSQCSHKIIVFDVVNDVQVIRLIDTWSRGYIREGWRIIFNDSDKSIQSVKLPDNRYEPSENYYFNIGGYKYCIGGYSAFSGICVEEAHFIVWKTKDNFKTM